MTKTIVALSVLALGAFATSSARADDAVSLHLNGGATEVAHTQWSTPGRVFTDSNFNTGMSAEGALLFRVVPNLTLGPDVGVSYLPQAGNVGEAAVLWTFGGAARLQGSKAHASWSPYLQGSGAVAKQGHIFNPELAGSVGVDFALEPSHTFWFGPYVAVDHTFQTNTAGERQTLLLDHHDANLITAGFSITFDAPVKPVHEVRTVEHTRVQTVVKEVPGPVQVQIVQVGEAPTLIKSEQVVLFDKDSAVVSDAGKKFLDKAATVLQNHPELSLDVEGHASTEGEKTHNWSLAQARAEAVVAYLVSKGVPATRLAPASFGPTGADGTDADLTNNRRVEFTIHVGSAN